MTLRTLRSGNITQSSNSTELFIPGPMPDDAQTRTDGAPGRGGQGCRATVSSGIGLASHGSRFGAAVQQKRPRERGRPTRKIGRPLARLQCLAVGVPIGASLRALPPIVPACSQKHRLVRTGALLRLVLGPSTAAGTSSTPRPSPQESGAVPGSRRAPAPQPTVRPVPGVFSRPGVGIFDLSLTSHIAGS